MTGSNPNQMKIHIPGVTDKTLTGTGEETALTPAQKIEELEGCVTYFEEQGDTESVIDIKEIIAGLRIQTGNK